MHTPMKLAACTLFENQADGRILVVWNRRAGGWCLPGGLVEDGERPIDAAVREVREETGIETGQLVEVYCAPHHSPRARADRVHVFTPFPSQRLWQPREVEAGCPVTWLRREELLRVSPFRDFYVAMFAELDARRVR
jgi:8-oxo-dGTP pyrophosphatase MutT (NUDIX family)